MGMACIANTLPAQKYSIRSTFVRYVRLHGALIMRLQRGSGMRSFLLVPVSAHTHLASNQKLVWRHLLGRTVTCVSAEAGWATPSFIHGAESSTLSKLQPPARLAR